MTIKLKIPNVEQSDPAKFLKEIPVPMGRGIFYPLRDIPSPFHPSMRGIIRIPRDTKKGTRIYVSLWPIKKYYGTLFSLSVHRPKSEWVKLSTQQKRKREMLELKAREGLARWKARQKAKEPPKEIKRDDLG